MRQMHFSLSAKRRSGFTLIEMLLYIALSSIILTITLHTMINVLQSRRNTLATAEVQQSIRLVINRMIDTSLNATDLNFGASSLDVNNGSLSFVLPTNEQNPTTYALSNGRITVQEGIATALPLTSPQVWIQSLRFTNVTPIDGTPIVRMELVASESGGLLTGTGRVMRIDTSLSLRQ